MALGHPVRLCPPPQGAARGGVSEMSGQEEGQEGQEGFNSQAETSSNETNFSVELSQFFL